MGVFDFNHPLAFTFGVLGNIVSILVYVAPLPTFIRIYKEKSTMGFDSLPYVVALFSSMLWMYYAFIKTNALLLISINSFGCLIETIYIFVFLFYASKKAKAHTAKLLGLMDVGLFSAIFLFTFFKFDGLLRVHIVGWICVIVSVCVFAAPLSIVVRFVLLHLFLSKVRVVRTRSVEFMPFPLSFFLTLSAIMWFGYGLLQHDICIALPNVLGFSLGMLQMILYAIFRNAKPRTFEEKKFPEQVINVTVVGTPDLHPVYEEKRGDTLEEIKHEDENNGIKMYVPYAACVEPIHMEPLPREPPVVVVCAA